MIIDFRCRPPVKEYIGIHKSRLFSFIHRRAGSFPLSRSMAEESMDLFWKEFAEAGIDKAVLPARYMPRFGSASNEAVVGYAKKFPDKFIGFAAVNFADKETPPAKQIEKAIKELGLKGVSMEPMAEEPPMYYTDGRLYPIYAKCEELGVPVLFTTGPFVGRIVDTAPSYIEQLAVDFPKLNFVLSHACYPYVLESIGLALRRRNVFLTPDLYTFLPGGKQWLDAANTILKDQFIFGSAYPLAPLKESVELIKNYPFKPDIREKVFSENARALLKI